MTKPTLLFATTTTEIERRLVDTLVRLGVRLGAELHVLLVEPRAPAPFAGTRDGPAPGVASTVPLQQRLAELLQVAVQSDLPVVATQRAGTFAATVLEHAEATASRWIALLRGAHLAGQLGPAPAVTDIIARSPVPVMLIPPVDRIAAQ